MRYYLKVVIALIDSKQTTAATDRLVARLSTPKQLRGAAALLFDVLLPCILFTSVLKTITWEKVLPRAQHRKSSLSSDRVYPLKASFERKLRPSSHSAQAIASWIYPLWVAIVVTMGFAISLGASVALQIPDSQRRIVRGAVQFLAEGRCNIK